MSQVDLARASGVKNSSISYLEKGTIGAGPDTAEALADALGLTQDPQSGWSLARFLLAAAGYKRDLIDKATSSPEETAARKALEEIQDIANRHSH